MLDDSGVIKYYDSYVTVMSHRGHDDTAKQKFKQISKPSSSKLRNFQDHIEF